MSHIVAQKTKFAINNKNGIISALKAMQSEFQGLTFQEKEGMILIRYAPIEVYQTKGNMRFIPTEDGKAWEMHYDYWNCQKQVETVRDSFLINYTKAGAIAYAIRNGFSAGKAQPIENGQRIIAQKW